MATSIRVDTSELDDFGDDLGTVVRNLDESSRVALEVANAVAAVARGRAPKLSGALAGSIRAGSAGSGAYVEAGAGLEYAEVHEYGWPGHGIAMSEYIWGSVGQEKPEEKFWEGVSKALRKAFPGLY